MFYIYRHIRLDTNEPFYVGKGSGFRAYSKNRNKLWKRIAAKATYKVEILKKFDNENDAYIFEEQLIKLYKSYNYCQANLSCGGPNRFKGSKPWNKGKVNSYSNEYRDKISKSRILNKSAADGNNPKAKKVKCIKTGKTFQCIKEAAVFAKIKHSTLRAWLNPNNNRENKSTFIYSN